MNSPLLGLDIGLKRTGVAISESGLLAKPLTMIEAKPPHMAQAINQIVALTKEHEIKTLVIGVPYTQDEALTGQALKVEQIIIQLEEALRASKQDGTQLVRVNEFGSSQEAARRFPKDQLDSASAAVILQEYLDSFAS